jgi:hypothetical protein
VVVDSGTARVKTEAARAQLRSLEDAIIAHPFVRAVEEGKASTYALQALAAEEHLIILNDRRTLARLAARFAEPPLWEFFLAAAKGADVYFELLAPLEQALDLDSEDVLAWKTSAKCQACTAFMSWLAFDGTATEFALAFAVWLPAWSESCHRIGEGLRAHYGLSSEETGFFNYFAPPPPEFEERLLSVIAYGLSGGDPLEPAVRAADSLQQYEVMFWDGLAERL